MLVKTTIILVVICILAYLLIRFVLRRFIPQAGKQRGQSDKLVLLERLMLEPRRSLQVVRAGGKVLLLAVSDGQISLLSELEPSEWEESGADVPRGGFKDTLAAVLSRTGHPTGKQGDDIVALHEQGTDMVTLHDEEDES